MQPRTTLVWFWMTDFEYADDVALLADSPSALRSLLSDISISASSIGLKINLSKTKHSATSTEAPAVAIYSQW